MIISKETLQVLKSFTNINNEIVFDEKNYIKIKNAKVIAYKSIKEVFPEFALSDLNSFISIISLFKNYDIEFFDGYCIITNVDSNAKLKYKFSEKNAIKQQLSKGVDYYESIKEFSGSFSLSKTVMKELETVSRMMNIKDLKIEIKNGSGKLVLISEMQSNSNYYEIKIDNASGDIDACIDFENMVSLLCDYDVYSINDNYFKFVPTTDNATYFIGAKR